MYLDRVDELPLDAQGKLLRLVEQKQVERLGSNLSVPVRARVVASASEDIEQAVADGRFRTDLYHRLRVLPLRVPSLTERAGDLPVLIRRVMADIAEASGRKVPALAPDALAALAGYSWPGNVRELGHVLERAVLNTDGPVLTATDLPSSIVSPELWPPGHPASGRRWTRSSAAMSRSCSRRREGTRAGRRGFSGSAGRRCGRRGSGTGWSDSGRLGWTG